MAYSFVDWRTKLATQNMIVVNNSVNYGRAKDYTESFAAMDKLEKSVKLFMEILFTEFDEDWFKNE